MAKATGTKSKTRSAPLSRHRPLADAVLRMIWRERRISRAEIARRAELSRSTVSEIVGAWLKTPLIDEVGTGPSLGGRKPIVLEFQDGAFSILGVEIGGSHVTVVLTDLRGQVLATQQRNHPVRSDPNGTRDLVGELCLACLEAKRGSRRRLVGIGVAAPTPIDPRHPDHFSEIVLPDWGGRGGLEGLSARFGAPMFIDNDANMGALAEAWWGAGRGVGDFAYVKLATGVGSGHVVNGEIYRGATGVAGEIGHLAIDPHGELCMCGLRGCLATFVGSQALVKRAAARLTDYPDSVLSKGELTIGAIEDAALAGDPLAMQLARATAEYLGIAVAGLLNLMNPSLVVLGGELSRLGDLLLGPLKDTVDRRTLVSSVAASDIRISELGPTSVAIGAATMVLKEALADSRQFPLGRRRAKTS